jgi:hypothetical protein
MISICIPIYNFDIRPLVKELYRQSQNQAYNIDIILIDDCSSPEFRLLNGEITDRTQYVQLEKNIGRAKIRNLFLNYTNQPYLLFLDCDAVVVKDDFLLNYLATISPKTKVVCGGRIYPSNCPSATQFLSWKYGTFRESNCAITRNLKPNVSFMTNNFMIARSLLAENLFEEKISGYGHEDTLFGFELLKKMVSITHIDNAILNGDIESNAVYLQKTENGISNLVAILDYVSDQQLFVDQVGVLRFYKKIERLGLLSLNWYIYWLLKPLLKLSLVYGPINLYVFDYYKLGLLQTYFRCRILGIKS